MPGSIQVTLKRTFLSITVAWSLRRNTIPAGETVFYNNNILHCAAYTSNMQRATLHACMGDTRGGSARARNILQHGLERMREDAFRETLTPEGRHMLERLVKMQEELHGKDIEYSLEGYIRIDPGGTNEYTNTSVPATKITIYFFLGLRAHSAQMSSTNDGDKNNHNKEFLHNGQKTDKQKKRVTGKTGTDSYRCR